MNEAEGKNIVCSTFSFFSPLNKNNWHQCKGNDQQQHSQKGQDHEGFRVSSSTFKDRIGGGTGKGEGSARENDPTSGATATFLPVW